MSSDPIVLPDPPSGLPGLSADDLAYMREVQADHRPTVADLIQRTEASDGMGGTETGPGATSPVSIRVSQADRIPEAVADRYGAGVVTIALDLIPVQAGDSIKVSATEAYEVVSDGATGAWATAQQVLAVRTTWPPAGA